MAATTNRLRFGTSVTPLARHRPQLLAHQLTTLDVLSGGRVVLGAGLGAGQGEWTPSGEPADFKVRAAMVDGPQCGSISLRAMVAGRDSGQE